MVKAAKLVKYEKFTNEWQSTNWKELRSVIKKQILFKWSRYEATILEKASYQSLRWWSSADSPVHPSLLSLPSRTLCQVSGLRNRTKKKEKPQCDTEIKSNVMFCLYKSTEVSPNERQGGSVVKWPAVSANGSSAHGKHKNALMWLDCTIDFSLIAFHGQPVLTVKHQCCICIDGSIGPLSWSKNTTCYDTAGFWGPLVSTIKPPLGLIAFNSFINSHRGHHTQSLAAWNYT